MQYCFWWRNIMAIISVYAPTAIVVDDDGQSVEPLSCTQAQPIPVLANINDLYVDFKETCIEHRKEIQQATDWLMPQPYGFPVQLTSKISLAAFNAYIHEFLLYDVRHNKHFSLITNEFNFNTNSFQFRKAMTNALAKSKRTIDIKKITEAAGKALTKISANYRDEVASAIAYSALSVRDSLAAWIKVFNPLAQTAQLGWDTSIMLNIASDSNSSLAKQQLANLTVTLQTGATASSYLLVEGAISTTVLTILSSSSAILRDSVK